MKCSSLSLASINPLGQCMFHGLVLDHSIEDFLDYENVSYRVMIVLATAVLKKC